MGCHTWFLKKVERTEEEATILALKHCDNCIELLIKGNLKNNNEFAIEVFKRYKRFIHKGLFKKGIWLLQPDDGYNEYIPNEGYFVKDKSTPSDIFRTDYTDEKLFSLPETLRFCNDHNITLSKEQKTALQKFWYEHPDGMINFG